ncbi:MAG TPA: DUF5990 family protein [Allosphingosinicella sp.]|jgi:hypothetical protein|nr:DUF5990 family protein [Allosphingosinicella sp.]
MARSPQTEIRMRLVIESPVPGVAHSLQDKKGAPVDAKVSAAGEALAFDCPIRIGPGPKFYGEQVRSEGPVRRFIYVAVGRQAGGHDFRWSRRMKIDIHDIPRALLDGAVAGKCLVGIVHGTAADGSPACATVPVESWRLD